MAAPTSLSLLQTGIPNLDLILGGGVPREDVILVIGMAGTGKTTLCLQTLFNAATAGENVIYVSTVSEPATKLLRHIRSFSFYDETLIGKRVFLVNAYPIVKQSLQAVTDALVHAVQDHHASIVVIDGLMSFHDLHPGAPEVRTFIYELGATLAAYQCTTIVTSSGAAATAEHQFPEFTMADGIILLETEDVGSQTRRRIRVRKMRGLDPLLGKHGFRIDDSGVTVYPRLESTFTPSDVGLSPERISTGMPELDALLNGGPRANSITVLAGAVGTGKTLAGLQFIVEGAKKGEKGVFVGFRETRQQLVDKARYFQIDLESALRDGRVEIFQRAPVDLDLDRITWEILQTVERVAPRRLVIDSVGELEEATSAARPARGYMAALAGWLHNQRITALVVKEIPQVIGPELDFSGTPLAILSENLVLMRWVEFRSEMYRILSILKMRDSAYDASIRQYTITDRGLHVLQQIETAEGLLTGIARITPEWRRRPRREE